MAFAVGQRARVRGEGQTKLERVAPLCREARNFPARLQIKQMELLRILKREQSIVRGKLHEGVRRVVASNDGRYMSGEIPKPDRPRNQALDGVRGDRRQPSTIQRTRGCQHPVWSKVS